jgi:N-acetylmuramic acid 6-phosphate etherase
MHDAGDRAGGLDALPSEAWVAELADLDLRAVEEQLALANAMDAEVPALVAAAADQVARVVQAAVERLGRGGRLRYVGAGTAGRVAALDAEEVAATFGVPDDLVRAVVAGGAGGIAAQGAEDDEVAGRADVAALGLGTADVLVAVSASGRTPYVLAAADRGRHDGALTVALVCAAGSPLAAGCDVAIEVSTGPELVAGSTRLRAGTAQKLVLNQVSTLTMVGLGHTYGNLMVGVRADNDKLVRRRARLLEQATGAAPDDVADALAAAGGDGKTAAVMLLAGVDADEARRRLTGARGYVRAAVATSAQA